VINELVTKSLLIFFGDRLPEYLTDSDSKFWPPVFTAAIVFPIALFRNLGSLRYFGLLSFWITIYIIAAVVYEAFNSQVINFEKNIKLIKYWDLGGLSTSLPGTIFAFMCHPNILDTFKELQRPSKTRMSKILTRLLTIVFFSYGVLGFFGYVTFADRTDQLKSGNILYADYNNEPVITAAILGVAFSCIFTQPMNIKPARDALRDIIFPYNYENMHAIENQDSNLRHFIFVAIVTFSQMFVAMYLTSLTNLINFLGSLIAPMICFILPSIFFFKLDPSPVNSKKKVECLLFLALMTIYSIYSTAELIIKVAS